jgi:hypothetical protein
VEGRPALDVRTPRRRVVGKNCCIDVHDDLPPRWVPGASVKVDRGLGQLDECGAAARRRPFTCKCHLIVLLGAVARGDVASGPDRHGRVCGRSPPGLGPVAAGGALGERVDRGEQMCALIRLQADAEDQHAVVVPPVLELSLQRQGRGVCGVGPSPLADESFGLRGGCRKGELEQRLLRVRLGDPGQGADLGVGEAPFCERCGQPGQRGQCTGDADVLASRAGGHAALPGEPVRAGQDADGVPALAAVELRDQP